jgi:TonB family protein
MSRSTTFFLSFVFTLSPLFVTYASAQQVEHPGIRSFKNENYREAINLLSAAVKSNGFKTDPVIWNYLGLAYLQVSDFKKARKAVERAISLQPGNSTYHSNLSYAYLSGGNIKKALSEAERAVTLEPKNAWALYMLGSVNLWRNKLDDAKKNAEQMMIADPAEPRGYVLASQVITARLSSFFGNADEPREDSIGYLREARAILKNGIEACKAHPHREILDSELETVEAFYDYFASPRGSSTNPAVPDPTVTPLNITFKPRASYTEGARLSGTQGVVRVAVLFGSNGRIDSVLILKRLGHGLDAEAVRAARQMRFTPRMKDGKPVSTVRIVEYSFAIY